MFRRILRAAPAACLSMLLASCGGGSSDGSNGIDRNAGSPNVSADVQSEAVVTAAAQACSYPNWTPGQSYSAGNIVRHPSNGQYYKASNSNPGYDPTISTWYWDPYTCSTPMPASTDAPAAASSCNYPDWAPGQYYGVGNIVKYPANGQYYRASNSNPGYDPTISTWYWSPYTCSGTTTSNGFIVTEAQFDQMFPNRIPFYTYSGLVAALSAYPAVFNAGTDTIRKQEAAAFLANIDQETGALQHVREINQANWPLYCQAGGQYPCAQGQQYYGRGPIQLSWNYNYGAAGQALGLNLLEDPDMVARDATVAWKTAIWYWMTQRGGTSTTPHDAIVNAVGFAETIRAINGGLECNQAAGSHGNQQMQNRVRFYQSFTQILGVDTGSNLAC
jgi:predicted chitinase